MKYRIIEFVVFYGGFLLVVAHNNVWVGLGVAGMILGGIMMHMRIDND